MMKERMAIGTIKRFLTAIFDIGYSKFRGSLLKLSLFDIRHSIFCGSLFCGSLILILFSGCGAKLPHHVDMRPLPAEPICRVAVLPFENESDYPLANAIAFKVFSAELQAAGNYLVVQEGDVRKIYQQLRIFPGQQPTPEEMQIMGTRLNAQLLITGTVMEMRENPGENASVNPVLAVDIQIRDGRSSVPLWRTYHRRQGTDYRKAMHFGTIHTATGLSQQVSREIINIWFRKGLKQCDVSPRF
jgi:polysaccharide biosynthesis protein PelC